VCLILVFCHALTDNIAIINLQGSGEETRGAEIVRNFRKDALGRPCNCNGSCASQEVPEAASPCLRSSWSCGVLKASSPPQGRPQITFLCWMRRVDLVMMNDTWELLLCGMTSISMCLICVDCEWIICADGNIYFCGKMKRDGSIFAPGQNNFRRRGKPTK